MQAWHASGGRPEAAGIEWWRVGRLDRFVAALGLPGYDDDVAAVDAAQASNGAIRAIPVA